MSVRIGGLAFAVLAAACASAPVPPPQSDPTAAANVAAERELDAAGLEADALEADELEDEALADDLQIEPTQRLFRLTADGPDGDGSFRLVARIERRDRYRLEASGPFGKTIWELDVDDKNAVLVEHRSQQVCTVTEGELTLDGLGVGSIRGESIVRILLGELPVELHGERRRSLRLQVTSEPQQFVDGGGRTWSVRFGVEGLASWTLWGERGPEVWWRQQPPAGGILSTRDGAQLRWRQVGVEPLRRALTPVVVPDAYREGDCRELGFS